MTDYVKSTNFTSKDSLASGNPLKIIKGSEFDTEFNNIATAIATKADINSPALTGTPTAPTAAGGTSTTQIATTAFVQSAASSAASTAAAKISTLTTWSLVEVAGVLYFQVSGVNKAKLDASGNLTVVGDITAFGSV